MQPGLRTCALCAFAASQAFVLDPAAPGGAAVSNAAELHTGVR